MCTWCRVPSLSSIYQLHSVICICAPAMRFGGGWTTFTPYRAGVAAEGVAEGAYCSAGHPGTAIASETDVAASRGEKIPDIPGREGGKKRRERRGREGGREGERGGRGEVEEKGRRVGGI